MKWCGRPEGRAAASPPLWSNGPRLHGGNPIGKDKGAVYQVAVFGIVCPASDTHGSDITYKLGGDASGNQVEEEIDQKESGQETDHKGYSCGS